MTMVDMRCPQCRYVFGFHLRDTQPAEVLCPRCKTPVPLAEIHQVLADSKQVMEQLPVSKKFHRYLFDHQMTHSDAAIRSGVPLERLKSFRVGALALAPDELAAVVKMMEKPHV